MSGTTPDTVIATADEHLPKGAVLTAAIIITAYVVPSQDGEEDRGPYFSWRKDWTNGLWVHLGMVESVAGDIRKWLEPE